MHLTSEDWIAAGFSALLIGFSKTGMPGAGIPAVHLMAHVFGGRASVGVVLPMLIFADCFAATWYRRHTRWDKLGALLPWVLMGMIIGGVLLWQLGVHPGVKDALNPLIGALVLIM